MGLAIPMKIKKIDGVTAIGEAGGVSRPIRVDFMEHLQEGDYVMVHAGFAIEKMTQQEAEENMRFLQEVRDAL